MRRSIRKRKAPVAVEVHDNRICDEEIVAAAFYGPDGKLITYYQRDPGNPAEIPPRAEASGYHSDSNEQRVFYRIAPEKETIGPSISSRTCSTPASACSATRASSPS